MGFDSNLIGNNNTFYGKTNGVSLFAGMYGEIAENLYAEPMRKDLPKTAFIHEADKILLETFKRLDRPEPETIKYLGAKKFFRYLITLTLIPILKILSS